jgi:D-alanyl-D-alanine carboxypeptidase
MECTMTTAPIPTPLDTTGGQPMTGFRATLSELSARADIADNDDLRMLALGASGHHANEALDVVDPTELIKTGPRPGDLLVRSAPSEGVDYLGVIVGDYIGPAEIFAARGVTVEAAGPGMYVEVAEVPFGGGRIEFSARRISDPWCRDPRGQMIYRPGSEQSTLGDDDAEALFESEELARHGAYVASGGWTDRPTTLTEAGVNGQRTRFLTSEQLRRAWSSYECAEDRMTPLRMFGRWTTPVNPETVDAWRAFERTLLGAGYQPHRAWVYNCRQIAGQQTRSLHAYGLAIDIDHVEPACNVNRPTPDGRVVRFSVASTKDERCHDVRRGVADTSFTPEQIGAVEAIQTVDGYQVFTWGGRWPTTKDTMHFQIAVTPTELARGISAQTAPADAALLAASDNAEAIFQALAEDVGEYEIAGGKYTAAEKERAAKHPAGLILTASVIGRMEQRLAMRAPYSLSVDKQWMRFGSGRLGEFVGDYNDFTYYFGEVLTGIGRLQDLLSAGAPEIPDFMTSRQKQALRPTTDKPEDAEKKTLYRDWRAEQARYASAEGGVLRGLVFQVSDTAHKFERHREAFWQATGDLKEAIADAKRLAKNKPAYDALDLKLTDALSLAAAIAEGGPMAPLTVAAYAVDAVINAREKRKDYDKKMNEFWELARAVEPRLQDKHEKVRNAQDSYWDAVLAHAQAVQDRDKARVEARQRAALLGQKLAPAGEGRSEVLAEIRMPVLVADAWRALAIIGPPARAKLRKTLAGRDIVEQASLKDLSWRGQQNPFADITQIRRAWQRALSWEPVLTSDAVQDWQSVNKLWDMVFNKFNV